MITWSTFFIQHLKHSWYVGVRSTRHHLRVTPLRVRNSQILRDQLETALETARLYSDTQRQAARVSLTQEVTDKLHRSLDMDNLMQTLLQEISTALGASDAFIQLSTPAQSSDSVSS